MRAVMRGAGLQMRTVAITPIALVTSYLTPLAVAYLVIARSGRPSLGLVTGAATAAVLNALVVQTVFAIRDERLGGTMQLLAAAPSGLLQPLVGRLLGALVQGLAAFPITVAMVLAVWGPDAAAGRTHTGAVLLTIAGAVAAAIGVFAMATVHITLVVRSTSYVGLVNGVFPVAIVVMGLFTPLSALPGPLRAASWLLPPAWAVEAVRVGRYGPLLLCLATAVGWSALGFALLRRTPGWLRRSPQAYTR